MIKFIFKLALFSFGLLALFKILAFAADVLAPDGNIETRQKDLQRVEELLNQSKATEALSIGNSHANSIDFKTLGYNGYLLTREDGDIFESQYYLETLIPRLPEAKTIFVAVSYFSFQWDNAISKEMNIRRTHMYIAVPSWRFIDGDFSNYVIGKIHPIAPVNSIVRADNWGGVIQTVLDNTASAKTGPKENDECKYREVKDLTDHAQLGIFRRMRIKNEMITNRPNLSIDSYRTVAEMIEYLQERGIRVVFYTPPYFEAYTKLYRSHDADTIVQMWQYMRNLQQIYNIEYYDFSMDKEFTANNHLFFDSDHLNHCGIKLFSAKLKKTMAENEN